MDADSVCIEAKYTMTMKAAAEKKKCSFIIKLRHFTSKQRKLSPFDWIPQLWDHKLKENEQKRQSEER